MHPLAGTGGHFRAFSDGPTIDGRQVQYSLTEGDGHRLYDESFHHIRTVSMPGSDPHDFLITEDDTLLFMGYKSATRDASHITDPKTQLPLSMNQRVRDAIIVERTLSGTTLFEWNSWDHVNIPDCLSRGLNERYIQINAFQLVDGDIVASFRRCHTVLRIDRSGGTGAVEWQIGGSSANPQTAFRPITGDDDARNEFCGQHNPSQVGDTVVVFDTATVVRDQGGPIRHSRASSNTICPPAPRLVSAVNTGAFPGTVTRATREGSPCWTTATG